MDFLNYKNLTPLQADLLKAFFEREQEFFLTGGGALVGFYLGHRFTDDLDLFTNREAAFERAPYVLAESVEALGAKMIVRQQSPGFHRYFVSRADEAVVVDLVLDRVPQIHLEKLEFEGLRIDPREEILVNKLNTIASRCEIRDVIDVMMLERSGFAVEDYLENALIKDGGCTPAVLAWVLSQIEISEEIELPGDFSSSEVQEFIQDLIRRLRREALP